MSNERDFAIVVGIEDYVTLKPLAGPINDAKAFHGWLLSPEGGNLPEKNAHLVLSIKDSGRPIQDDIDEKLQLISEAGGGSDYNRFYFYFAGHGYGKDWKENGLCLPKWSNFFRNSALSSASYLDGIINIGLFKEVFFFLDCCRDKIYSVLPLPPTFGGPAPLRVAESFVAYAAEFDNPAYEANISADSGHPLVRGHFTTALVTGLSGGAVNEAGIVTTDSIKGYLKSTVEDLARHHRQKQTVRFNDAFTMPATITVPSKKPTIDAVISFKHPGYYVLEGPHATIVKEGHVADESWNIPLHKGLHAVKNTTTGEEKYFRIDLTINPFVYEF